MSSTTATLNNPWAEDLPKPAEQLGTYLANLPDFKDSKRLEVRQTHLEHAAEGHKKGWIVIAGAMFEEEAGSKMIGSWMLIREESLEAARKRLARDIYAQRGAWDMDSCTIRAVAVAKH